MEGVQVKIQVFLMSALGGIEIHAFAVLRVTKRLCYDLASRIVGLQEVFGYSAEQTGLLGNRTTIPLPPIL